MNYQVNYDMKKIYGQHLDFDAIKKISVEYLQQQPGIQYAVDVAKIGEAPIPEPILPAQINAVIMGAISLVREMETIFGSQSSAPNSTSVGRD